jgi:hypothetical protein
MRVRDIIKKYNSSSKSSRRLNIIDEEFSHHATSKESFTLCTLVKKENLLHHFYSCNPTSDSSNSPYAKFLIASEKGCHTGFHLDYYGCGVYMHIVSGCKLFFTANLSKDAIDCCFDKSVCTDIHKFNGHIRSIGGCITASLVNAGETIFLPQGCVHAALTLEDTLSYAGNFLLLDDLSVPIQIFEIDCLDSFDFPDFPEMVRYASKRYVLVTTFFFCSSICFGFCFDVFIIIVVFTYHLLTCFFCALFHPSLSNQAC